MGEQRNQKGRFTPEHTDDEILAAVRTHEPAATSEVAGETDMTRQGADRRLRKLRDEGRVNSKKIGASLVWFAPNATESRERAENRIETNTVDTTAKDERQQADTETRRDDAVAREGERVNDEGPVNTDELPATVNFDDAAAAIGAARAYIREHGEATKDDLVRHVMVDHPAGYDVDAALAKLDGPDRYRGAWWRNVVKPGLKAADDVENPEPGESKWKYDGEDADT